MLTRITSIILILTAIAFHVDAQTITKYGFAASSGTFTNLSGAVSPTLSSGNTDEGYFNNIPIGFEFWYMGVRYTTLSASTNGWLILGTSLNAAAPGNDLTNYAQRPILAPLWDDLDISAATKISYLTSGSAGSRVFTTEYLNVKWARTAASAGMSFQVKLYEGSGKVEFTYRQESGSINAASASIGITGVQAGSGNFLSVSSAGTSVSSTGERNVNIKPVSGNRYAFTPPVPATPASLIFTSVSTTAMTINWSDQSTNENGFLIYKSIDGISYSFVTQTAANATSSLQSGLTASVVYYWKVYAISEGGFSAALGGSQMTLCQPPSTPIVTSPVSYCQNETAVALTASGTNLLWGGVSGTSGGTSVLGAVIYLDNTSNNKRTMFATSRPNVTISSVDYYIPAWQAVNNLTLSIYNSAGAVIATSTTATSMAAGSSPVKIKNIFNYTITSPGDYSVGVSLGSGNLGSDSPIFPMTESTGTLSITGVTSVGYRVFNNIQFATVASATAPVPSTSVVGTTLYYVSQTVGGCTSALIPVTVNVTAPSISQTPSSGLLGDYRMNGNAVDVTGNNSGVLQNAPAAVSNRFNNTASSLQFNGSSQFISTSKQYTSPALFTLGVWFKTNTTTGGKLIGFGNNQNAQSSVYDRHIYMNNAGQIYFGVYPGTSVTVNSPLSYNDNKWHHVIASLSSSNGMRLYMDGVLVASNSATTTAEANTGYWKIGFDNTVGWPSAPSSNYFNGAIDDVLIYNRELTAMEADVIYRSADGAGNNGPVCAGSPITLNATTIAGATYSWTGPDGFTSSAQNPVFTFSAAKAGVYTLQVTVSGCTSSAYTVVASTTGEGQWTGNVSTDWADANNWCSGVVPSSSTNVTITSSAVRMPVITATASCKNLTINSEATLVTTSTGTLQIAGLLVNNGTMTNSGTTVFNGASGQQTFSGVAFFGHLTIANPAGVLLPSSITIANNLTLTAGSLNTNNYNIGIGGNWINNAATTALLPGTSTVTFTGSTPETIGGTFSTTFKNINIASTGSTVALQNNIIITGDLLVTSGTLDLAGYTANRSTSGGLLTVFNNATLRIGGTNSFPTNYGTTTLVVASTVEYSGTNQNITNVLYGNLALSSSSGASVKTFPATPLTIVGNLSSSSGTGVSTTFAAASAINVNGNVMIGSATTFNGGSFSHTLGGNWINEGTFNGSTGTVTFTGSGTNVTGTGAQNFNNLTIAASLMTFPSGNISLSGNLATTGAGSFTQGASATLTMTGTAKTISGQGITLNNVTISGSVSTNASLDVAGNMAITGTLNATFGAITMSGNTKNISGAGTKNFSTLVISGSVNTSSDFSIASALVVNGSLTATSGSALFTGSATLSGTADLYNVNLSGTSLKLSSNATLGVANALTITSGTLDVTSSIPNTVNFNGTGAQSVNAIVYYNLSLSNSGNKTAQNSLVVTNTIRIESGATFTAGTFTHHIYNDWINSGTFTAGTGTIEFLGSATTNIIGNTAFNILTVNNTTDATQILVESDVSAAIVNMISGRLLTGVNTITITNTRTGNGRIYGNIKRLHTFVPGVSYAFKSPDNTILFSSVSGVSEITVTAEDRDVDDFPFGTAVHTLYTIAVPAGTYNATLRLDYEDDELNGNAESSMGMWNYNGAAWIPLGKSANNTTSNYVEKSGLTNMTNRWTLSSVANIVQWNGSVNSDWHTAANWTSLQGSPSLPPSASDVVNLGTISFVNQPVISSSETINSIIFGSTQAVNVTLTSGGSLTTVGNIAGEWNIGAHHTINTNSQNLMVNGNFVLSDGTAGQSIDVTIGSGSVHVVGSLIQSGDASISFSGAGTLSIHEDFIHNGGPFDAGSGTVIYEGNENQHIAHVTYNDLTINKAAGLAVIDSITTINRNLSITSGELDITATTEINGDVIISPLAIFDQSGMLHVGGNWLNSGTFVASTGTIYFDGAGTQTISPSTFNNFTVDKPVGASAILTGDIVLTGDLTIVSGTFNIKTFACNRNVQGGTITFADPATFIVGANNSPLNFSNGLLANGSTVIADGIDTQYIFGVTFGNLVFRNAGVKILVAPITINGDLVIEAGSTFDGGSETLTLNGNWINQGTFIPSASAQLWSGTSKTISGNSTFNKVTTTGSYTILNDATFNNLLDITATGSLRGGSTLNVVMNGDFTNRGIMYTLGTTTFTGTVLQTLSLINAVQTVAITVNFNGTVSPVLNSTSTPQYGYLNINNTGGVNPSVGWTIAYTLNVGPGALFNGGVSAHQLFGSLTNNGTITTSGSFSFIPASAATLNFGTAFSSTGTVTIGGTGAISILGSPAALNDVVISNTNAIGIAPASDWTISNNFTINSGSVFQAGNHLYSISGNIRNYGTLNGHSSTFSLYGGNTQEITTSSAFNNLTISKSANDATLFSDVQVDGELKFVSQNIVTGTFQVLQPASGSVTGASQSSGWVNGYLSKNISSGTSERNFEVGDASVYAPLSVTFSGVTTPGNLIVSSTAGDHPDLIHSGLNPSKSVNRFWTVTSDELSFSSYNATFNYATTDVDAGANTSAFRVAASTNGTWSLPLTALISATSTQATSLPGTGDFVIAENCHTGTSIAYASSVYCSSAGTAQVTLTGSAGGTFSSASGLAINASTGDVDLALSTPGTYAVTYDISSSSGCGAFQTSSFITITAAPVATIAYPGNPFCSSSGTAVVTLIGTAGGSFSAPSELIIDASTGVVDLSASVAGSYTVSYTVSAAGGCAAYIATTTITVTTQPFATGTYEDNPYCTNGGIAFPTGYAVGLAGTLTSTSGLSIDPPTGVIDLAASTAGVYTVTYNVPAFGGCSEYSTTATVAISAAPSATIAYGSTSYCSNAGVMTVNRSGTTGGSFSAPAGLILDPVSGSITPSLSTPDTYTVTYSMTGPDGCANETATTQVTITAAPSASISYPASPYYVNQGTASVAFSGTTGGVFSSTTGLVINATTGTVTPATSQPGSYTVTYTIAASGGCTLYTTTANIVILNNSIAWDGGAGTIRWEDANNWTTDYVPSIANDIDLTNADTIVIETQVVINTLTINDAGLVLDIRDNGTLHVVSDLNILSGTLRGGSSPLQVGGNWTNNGNFIANSGTVEFNGGTTQHIAGTATTNFHDMDVTNATANPGMAVDGSANVTGVMTLSDNVVVDADGASGMGILTLISSADNPASDAAIGILPVGARINGNVTVQRFMTIEGAAGGRIYRYISSPVQQATVADIQHEIPITGSFTGSTVCVSCGKTQSMFSYLESVSSDVNGSGTADLNDGYMDFPDASNNETLAPGRGYALFARGNLIPSALWDVRGAVNTANEQSFSFPVTYTPSGSPADDGWNLVGNPFPSTIDWNADSGWVKENINGAIYITNNGFGSTQFATWNGVVGINGGSRYITTGQAFWTRANGSGTPVLQASEYIKAPEAQATFFREQSLRDLIRVTLVKGSMRDETVVYFAPEATEGFDSASDAFKLQNGTINISSILTDGSSLAINSLPPLNCENEVKLNVGKSAVGTYQLAFSEFESFSTQVEIILTDHFTNTTFNVSNGNYTFSITSNASSYGAARFTLHFAAPAANGLFELSTPAICEGNDATVTIEQSQDEATYDAFIAGINLQTTTAGDGGTITLLIAKEKLSAGENVVTITSTMRDCKTTASKQVVVKVERSSALTSVENGSSCNPGIVTLHAAGAPSGGYYNWYQSPTDVTPIADQHSASFTTPFLNKTETWYVAVVNGLGCEDTRIPAEANIGNLQDVLITAEDDSLRSSYTYNNQWYFNHVLIEGATNRSIKPHTSGVYSVIVTAGECSTTSDFEFIVTGVEESTDRRFSAYPNPVSGVITIETSESLTNPKEIRILTAQGILMKSMNILENPSPSLWQVDMTGFPAGLYLIRVIGSNEIRETKVIKL